MGSNMETNKKKVKLNNSHNKDNIFKKKKEKDVQ